MHDRNIMHRDLKPENILLNHAGIVKICDFGWSCLDRKDDTRMSLCGTFEYMAPEVFKGSN